MLVVESNAGAAESLVHSLRRHGHSTSSVDTGGQAFEAYMHADLVLIDLELPDLDGLEVCRQMRAVSAVPIIVVTARATELDRVLGLQAGADDYLAKPYGLRELLARMDAVMRRAKPQQPPASTLTRGPLCIDARTREVWVDDRLVDTTRKEFDLLYLLASRPGEVIARQQVVQEVWGNSWSRRTLDTHVSSLRGKLGSSDWIITVRGVGFRLGGR
ncbi:response regulator transcription factor [Streptomyces hygroscopicus]|uniref:response regulator transcription factor n=1 Tax=Streptomyces hygroscopicus TaxID=1912 RepID=UPI002059C34A|nr:DNA-binding response regulator [Streptomyces hygroscopicus]